MTSRQVETTFYWISGLYTLSTALIWGINTLFLLDAGLSLFQVFFVNAAFTAGMFLFEIPTGVFADTKGRRFSFLFSTAVVSAGTLGYVGASYWGLGVTAFFLMSIVLGLGFTFYSGAVEAWLVDALDATGFNRPKEKVFSRGAAISSLAMLFGTVGGGFLGTADLRIPYLFRALFLMGAFIFALFRMREIGFEVRPVKWNLYPGQVKRIAAESIRFGWRRKSVRLIIIAGLFQNVFMMWGFYGWQPYLLDLLEKPGAVWVAGFVSAGLSLSILAGNLLGGRFSTILKRRTTALLAAALLTALSAVGMGLAGSFTAALVLLYLMVFSFGLYAPGKQAYLHELIPSDKRATVISFESLVGNGGGVAGQSALGAVAERASLAAGYVAGGVILLFVLPPLMLLRRRNDPEDSPSEGREQPPPGEEIPPPD